jgi:hypothetical protein
MGPKGDTGATGLPGQKGDTGPAGAQGPKGDTGAAGPQGSKGDAGPAGPQGPKGDVGSAGAQGAIGPVGPQGPVGAMGPQGSQGPQGLKGDTGAAGVSGVAGPVGPQGAQGAIGPVGPRGSQGLTWQGLWLNGAQYAAGDAVQFNGSAYVALQPSTNQSPDTQPTFWSLLAQKGEAGATGATGAQGPQGATGAQGMAGASGSQGPQGSTGPQGPAGPQGAQGPQGPAGSGGANVAATQTPCDQAVYPSMSFGFQGVDANGGVGGRAFTSWFLQTGVYQITLSTRLGARVLTVLNTRLDNVVQQSYSAASNTYNFGGTTLLVVPNSNMTLTMTLETSDGLPASISDCRVIIAKLQ